MLSVNQRRRRKSICIKNSGPEMKTVSGGMVAIEVLYISYSLVDDQKHKLHHRLALLLFTMFTMALKRDGASS